VPAAAPRSTSDNDRLEVAQREPEAADLAVAVGPGTDVVEATESGGAVGLEAGAVVDVAAVSDGAADECDLPLHALVAPSTITSIIAAPLDLIRPAWHGRPREDVS
jgi:hypothetical protein